mmetsp:Transcript_20406/g.36554  ORF Transcript_20406/g.36554 Transcript_20406/m.36554 type:complete len:1130 (-) Transcript_20406:47-3436(-)
MSQSDDELEAGDLRTEALAALLTGGPNLQLLRKLGHQWGRRCLESAENCRNGLFILLAVAGLRGDHVPSWEESPGHNDIDATMLALLKEATTPPPQGSLPTLSRPAARQVTTRLIHFFAAATATLAVSERNAGPAVAALVTWLVAMADSTPLRVLRLACTAAGLGMLQAFTQEICVARATVEKLKEQLDLLHAGVGSDRSASARDASKAARLCRSSASARQLLERLASQACSLQELLRRRLRDAAPSVRRLALNALLRLIHLDPATFAESSWKQRLLRGLSDPSSEVRLRVVELVAQVFSGTEHSERTGRAEDAEAPDALAARAAQLLAERAKDVEPQVAAAAVRSLRQSHLATLLSDWDFAVVASLCMAAPETHACLRLESALFVDKHLLPDPGLRIQQHDPTEGLEQSLSVEQGLLSLADFLSTYLTREQMQVSSRLVQVLWGKADCLRHWASIADLCLLGEGSGPAREVPTLSSKQRLALLHVLQASASCALQEAEEKDLRWLESTIAELLPRLPALFDLVSTEQDATAPLALLTQQLLRRACQPEEVTCGPPRALLSMLLRYCGRQEVPLRPRTLLHLTGALVSLATRSRQVQSSVQGLVADLIRACEAQLPQRGAVNELTSALVPLVALGQTGVDIWKGGPSQGHLIQGSLRLLEARAAMEEGDKTGCELSAASTARLLMLLGTAVAWQARTLGDGGSSSSEGQAGLMLCCSTVRSCCAKLLANDRTFLVQIQSLSTYFLALQLQIGACKGHAGQPWPSLPEDEVAAVDAALAYFQRRCPSVCSSLSAAGWRLEKLMTNFERLTASSWLIERLLDTTEEEIDGHAEEFAVAHVVSLRMVAECEHEAIYAGPPAKRLFQLSAAPTAASSLERMAGAGVQAQVRDAAAGLARRLRCFGCQSSAEAFRGFSVQFAACASVAEEKGSEAGARLAEVLLQDAGPALAPSSRAAERLGKGLALALRSYGLAAASGGPSRLDVLLPWLREPGCTLQPAKAKELAGTLASAFGLAAGSKGSSTSAVQVPGAWALVHALQVSGTAPLRRSMSWKAKMQERIRRMRRKEKVPEPSGQDVAGTATPSGWLSRVKREEKPQAPPPKRIRHQSPQEVSEPPRSENGRKWQLRAGLLG